ncbi:unnamed protein product, partial [Meganyctiphanes norvegica]
RGLLWAAVLLLSAALAAAAPKGILSHGPEDADTSFILNSRGGIETFHGAIPDNELLARHEILKEQESPENPGSEYQVAYEVNAPSTGDQKSFVENRYEDGSITGQYTVLEADGSLRLVTYSFTPEEGFKANVEKKAPGSSYNSLLSASSEVSNVDVLSNVINVDRLGTYDDSNAYPSYYGGFRTGLSRPFEEENLQHDVYNSHLYLNENGVVNRFEGNQVGSTKEAFENLRNDGQFGSKIAAHITNDRLQNNQPFYRLIPVSIHQRRTVPFTVLPVYLRRHA